VGDAEWGVAAEYRGEAGTTQVFSLAKVYGIHRPLAYMNMGLGGVQYRWLKNQHAALNVHAYGGIAYGVFDAGTAGSGAGDVGRTPAENACLAAGGTVPPAWVCIAITRRRSSRWAAASISTGRRTGRSGCRRT